MKSWPEVALGEVMEQDTTFLRSPEPRLYPKLSVKLYGRGVVLDASADGSRVRLQKHQLARAGQVIVSEIWAKKGAIGIVPPEGDGALCTTHFFLFNIDHSKVLPGYVKWLLRGNYLAAQLDSEARGTTGYASIRPRQFLAATIPLPSIPEQESLVMRLNVLAEKAQHVESHLVEVERQAELLLALRFRDALSVARLRPMAEVAPLVRREVKIAADASYTEIGVRSFFKGTFHRRVVRGAEFTWQKMFRIEANDLIFSNIMSWEKGIALAKAEDHGCVGNHRILTCLADARVATPRFVSYYFTTEDGFAKVYAASPGTAARNRTLIAAKLAAIEVPLPPLAVQFAFDRLQSAVAALKTQHAAIREANGNLLPATLGQVFSRA